jgi:hypothetical protein
MAELQDSSIETDRERLRFWLVGGTAALALLVGVVWLARPHYRHYKEQRSEAQAQAFLAAGDYRNAALCARQALNLNLTNVVACRVMAALAELSHSPVTLDWRQRVVEGEPSVENKLQLAATALRYQAPPFALTAQILTELAPTATNLASYQVTMASYALGLRQFGSAESHFETAVQLDPTNQLYELNLAVLRLAFTNQAKVIQSRARLEQFRTDATLGPAALRALVVDRLANRDFTKAEAYSAELLAQPRVTLSDQLQQLGILRQLRRSDLGERLRGLQQSAATNAPAVAQVTAWMLANERGAEAIQWLTGLPAAMRTQSAVRLALADAYLQAEDWRALHDLTTRNDWEELNFLRLALAARAWSQLGAQQSADSNWRSAVSAAGNRYGALTALLGLAERWKLPREREVLLELIAEKFPAERWAQELLEQWYVARGKTAELNAHYARTLVAFPDSPVLKNNLAFTSLLLKTNLARAFQYAAEAYAAGTNTVTASTYAFALHLQGRTAEGLVVLQQLAPAELQTPDVALYHALLLGANGDTNQARACLKLARTKTQWLPEERQWLTAAGE